ncbi:MAG: Transcriptional regulator containing an amidase domain and an AraC-type DNA-binding domain [Edaphobacter sp.]|nr:Transcriptional regulator containing an amidase domain and an AraC-type DNA-binding domain [Edaphobacter sp.]
MNFYRRVSLLSIVVLSLGWSASGQQMTTSSSHSARYAVPAKGTIPIAFVITDDAVTIDFAGPWEVFKDVFLQERGKTLAEQAAFRLYTVSDSREPVKTSGGMRIVPDYTFDDAPQPAIVVVPAQRGRSPKMMEWIRKMTTKSDVVMSVCTGADVLGDAGVLKGKKATTHHLFYDEFQRAFPDVSLQKDKRFVQSDPVIFTAGGLSSGIDLALHIVELYFGPSRAEETAKLLEYEGAGWKGDGSASGSVAAGHDWK